MLFRSASKIAEKTGKPYIVNNFENPNGDASKTLIEQAKKLGVKFDEILTDGKNGKKLIKPVFVGKQPIIKLRHIIAKKQGCKRVILLSRVFNCAHLSDNIYCDFARIV